MHKIKRVVLIRPPVHIADKMAITDINFFFPPVGIALLSAVLKKSGYNAIVKDMYEYNWQDVRDYFTNNKYDVVGITCFSGQHFSALQVAEIAKKKIEPAPLVIMGGPHPSAYQIDTQIINGYPQIDFIVRQEGDETLPELLAKINDNAELESVKGITYRKNGAVVRTADREALRDLDALPFPDYSFLDFKKTENISDGKIDILDKKRITRFAPIISSRGCPNRCQFCAIFMGRQVRFRSPENVVEEIEELSRVQDVTHFTFVDDCFNASLPRAEKICRLILERKIAVTWTAMARVRPLTEDFLRMAKESGCLALNFGVESGSRAILKTISKNINLDDFMRAVELARNAGINSAALFIVGNPGENNNTVNETISLIKRSKPRRVVVSPLIILPNSELHAFALKQGVIDEEYWLKHNDPPHYTAEHTLDELRFLRIKILFWHHFYQREILMAYKLILLIAGYKFVKLFNIEINQARDFLLKLPVISLILKRVKTA